MSEYAIITFRDSGPIKTVSAVRATNVHNARTKPLKHAIVNAPKPRFLVGTNNLLKDITRALANVEIDIRKPQKNGVLAYEAILSASAAFFERGPRRREPHCSNYGSRTRWHGRWSDTARTASYRWSCTSTKKSHTFTL